MEKIQLKTTARNLENRSAEYLYKQGLIPAELYGHKVPNTHLAINAIEFDKVLRKAGESTVIEVMLPDGKTANALIQDVQSHYLTTKPIHVDLYAVNMTEKLTATVAIEFIGESDAVRVLAGTLVKVLSEVEVECLPGDLPSHFEVDISVLKNFDDAIMIKDIPVSDKVEIKGEPDEMIAKVQAPRDMEAEDASAPVDEAAAVAAAVGTDETAEAAAESKE